MAEPVGPGDVLQAVPHEHALDRLGAGDLAYLAGVLDSRAVVRVRFIEDSEAVLPYIAMSCGDARLMRWLGELTGVRSIVTTRKYDKHRCLEHCDKAHDHITSVSGRWSLTGVRATVVLCGDAGVGAVPRGCVGRGDRGGAGGTVEARDFAEDGCARVAGAVSLGG